MVELSSRAAEIVWFTKTTSKSVPLLMEAMVIAFVLRLLGLVEPFVFQTIIDRVIPFQREATLSLIVAVLFLTTLFSAILGVLVAYLGNHMANRMISELAGRIYRHVLNLPLRVLQRWPAGETLSRIGETDTVRSFLTGTISGAVLDALFAVIYIAALLAISPFLTTIVLITLPLQSIMFGLVGPILRRRMQEAFLASSRHQARMIEAFASSPTVKATASEEQHADRFQETLDASLSTSFNVARIDILNGFFGQMFGNTPSILIVFLGSQMVFRNEITLGEMIAFHLLAGHVSAPIASLASVWEQWQGLKIARLRLGDFLNVPTENDSRRSKIPIAGPINFRLRNVTFGYVPGQLVIQGMDIDIEPGQPTLIIGDSGCGKSTMGKLLCGLYTPDTGFVTAGGADLANHDPHSVRRAIAYLPQEPVLFSGTILDNLRLTNPNASDLEIEQALFESDSARIVAQLPDGIHTEVGERGSFLSGGQRQRIALARALLGNPSALILDEPTSALDAQAAARIADTLQRLSQTKTLVVITHNQKLLGDEVRILNLAQLNRDRTVRLSVSL